MITNLKLNVLSPLVMFIVDIEKKKKNIK